MGKCEPPVDKKNKRTTGRKRSPRKIGTVRQEFRSGLEDRVAKQLTEAGVTYQYEPQQRVIRYVIPESKHTYLPDFVLETHSGKHIYIETKGRWLYPDRYKHYLIKQQCPELDVRFVFSNASARLSKSSSVRYRDICEGHGRGIFKGQTWKYSDKGLIDPEWLKE